MTKIAKRIADDLLEKTRNAGKELRDGIQSLRDQINDLKAERENVRKSRVTEEVALKRVDDWAAGLAELAAENAPTPNHFSRHSVNLRPGHYPLDTSFMAYLGPLLAEAAKLSVSTFYSNLPVAEQGMAEGDREHTLARLDQRILDDELSEESIIRAAESAGLPVLRREDADPRALLAKDEDLP